VRKDQAEEALSMPDIVRSLGPKLEDSSVSITPPENIPRGSFLHVLNTSGFPVLAEGVIPIDPALREPAAQAAVSRAFNQLERNMIHASHMIPREFGGSGEKHNLIALPKEFNLGRIRAFERSLKEKLKSDDLYLQVFAQYIKSQQIPQEVFYRVFEMKFGKPFGLAREHAVLILH
jgi:hypothetical protein